MIYRILMNEGYVSALDTSDLRPGELQSMSGCYYKRGDTRLWKQLGRTAFGTVSAGTKVKGAHLAKFDTGGTDQLLALSGTTLYGATPGTTGTFSSLATGLDAGVDRLIAKHWSDTWYLVLGGDESMKLLKPDGTVRNVGMAKPDLAPTVTTSNVSYSSERGSVSSSSGFSDTANAVDDGTDFEETAASASPTSTPDYLILNGWSTIATTGRRFRTLLNVAPSPGKYVQAKLYISEDGTETWDATTLKATVNYPKSINGAEITGEIANATTISDVRVKLEFTEDDIYSGGVGIGVDPLPK